jgi:hypothetical protein
MQTVLHADGFSGMNCVRADLIGSWGFMWTSTTKVPSTSESIIVERSTKLGNPRQLPWLPTEEKVAYLDVCMLATLFAFAIFDTETTTYFDTLI